MGFFYLFSCLFVALLLCLLDLVWHCDHLVGEAAGVGVGAEGSVGGGGV